MDSKRFLVVGGGIGGLITALAMARQGHRVRVLEKAEQFGEIGAGIQVAPNASRALDRLGLLEAATADAFFPRRMVLMDAMTGEEVTAIDNSGQFVEEYGFRYFVTHRADLHRALLGACEAEPLVSLSPASEVIEVINGATGVRATCVTGESLEADALIGADGLWSMVRRTVFGDEKPPVDSGYVAHRGTVPMPDVTDTAALALVDCMVIWLGPSFHLVQYPVRRGELRNQVAVFDTRVYGLESDDYAEQLRNAYRGACETVANGVKLIDTSKRWDMVDRAPIDEWVKGRVALLGDAAHPMLQYLAQGGCQAIEDAVVLGDVLSESNGSIDKAFATYEAARSPRAARVQRNAANFGEIFHMTGVSAMIRNELLSRRRPTDFAPVDWLYAPGAERAGSDRPPIPIRVAADMAAERNS